MSSILSGNSTVSASTNNNVSHFSNRGPLVFAVTTATLVLATAFVFARMACRTLIVKRVNRDDWLMVIAWVFALGLSITIDVGARNGLGRHDKDIAAEHWNVLRRCEYVFTVLYVGVSHPSVIMLPSSSQPLPTELTILLSEPGLDGC
jgi:hypothetical protein